MAKFLKSLFSSNTNLDDRKKDKIESKRGESEEDNREFSHPYDTKRKLSISRSGRMKQNLWARGRLGNDLYGEIPKKTEKTAIEYHVNKRNFFDDDSPPPSNVKDDIFEKNTMKFSLPPEGSYKNILENACNDTINTEDHSEKIEKKKLGNISELKNETAQESIQDVDSDSDLSKFDEDIKTIIEFNETNF